MPWKSRSGASQGHQEQEEKNAHSPAVPRRAFLPVHSLFLTQWLDATLNRKMDSPRLGERLRQAGDEHGRVDIRIVGARTTRNIWVLPTGFHPPDEGVGQPEDGNGEEVRQPPEGRAADDGDRAQGEGVDNGPASTADSGIHEGEGGP